jgi:hypothetical protein
LRIGFTRSSQSHLFLQPLLDARQDRIAMV